MIHADEARGLILQKVCPLGAEEVLLSDSLGRFLSQAVTAPISLPPFDNSAMDGFAVGSGGDSFQVLGTIAAGDRGPSKIHSGEAFRIMTGALVPEGAYAVVPFEEWPITSPVIQGSHIRRAGEDVPRGERVLDAGERINSRTISLLAALGLMRVGVVKRPRVRILSTGSELVSVGAGSSLPGARTAPLQPGQIYNSNGPALAAALKEMGIESPEISVAADTEAELKKAISPIDDVDVLITIGAVSVGDFDLVPKVLKDLGAEIVFHKVAIKPGKPLLYGMLPVGAGSSRPGARTAPLQIFGLPGNPVSALMVFDRFVRPALLKMMGAKVIFRVTKSAIASEDLKGSSGKEDYLRGVVEYRDGRYVARSAGSQGSARLVPLAKANAVIIIPADRKSIAAGETVTFEFLSGAA